jgi:hypothetical protein
MYVEIVDRPDHRGTLSATVKPEGWRILSASLETWQEKVIVTVEMVRKEGYGEDKQTCMDFSRGRPVDARGIPIYPRPRPQDTATLHGNYRGPNEG